MFEATAARIVIFPVPPSTLFAPTSGLGPRVKALHLATERSAAVLGCDKNRPIGPPDYEGRYLSPAPPDKARISVPPAWFPP